MNIIQSAEIYVEKLLNAKLLPIYTYHSISHTKDVVNAVVKISNYQNISYEYKEKLIIAAWFHDTGFTESFIDHESKSIEIVTAFLIENNCSTEYINDVVNYINVTRFDYIPKNELEYIIKDADYSHFALNKLIKKSESLRQEWRVTQDKHYSDLEWLTLNFEMLSKKHHYYSKYAIENWQPEKEKNIQRISKKINSFNDNTMENDLNNPIKKIKEEKSERIVDTMFKITLTNHIRLSDIADSKANILLSVNAIIVSIALSTIIPKLDSVTNKHLIIPTFIMVIFSVISIIFAILSTKPNIYSETVTKEDIETKKVNLLFFGNFYKMTFDEYEVAMNGLIKDKDYILSTMIKDLYYLGIVLQRKYSLLRTTYNIFLIGIIITVFSFVIAFYGIKPL